MSPPPFDDEPTGAASGWQPQGSLDASGRLEGGIRRAERRSPTLPDEPESALPEGADAAGSPTLRRTPVPGFGLDPLAQPGAASSRRVAEEEPALELQPHTRRRAADFVRAQDSAKGLTPHRRPRPWLALALLLGVALVGLTVFRAWRGAPSSLVALVRDPVSALSPAARSVVTITSEPAGATVRIDGLELGTTPWAGDNVWGREVPVELTRPGYRPWRGTLGSGPDVRVRAKLQRGR